MIELSIPTLANGALNERLNEEIGKVIANISDPNTPAEKARAITMKMTIKPNKQRNMADVFVATSSTLCAPTPIETGIYIGFDPKTGEIGASEFTSGEKPAMEEKTSGKVVNFVDRKSASAGND